MAIAAIKAIKGVSIGLFLSLEPNATDLDGATLLGTVTSAPYTFAWTNVAAGNYTITAVATDNQGAATTSAPFTVTVSNGVAQMYYIDTDHLGTPRVITNSANQIVWQWENTITEFKDRPPRQDGSALCRYRLATTFTVSTARVSAPIAG